MSRVHKIEYQGKEVLVSDYSSLKGAEMIEVLNNGRALIESENKRVLSLILFEKNYVNSDFMRLARELNTEIPHLMGKQAIVGLTVVQKSILKGFNMFTAKKNELKSFDTIDEALKYLVA